LLIFIQTWGIFRESAAIKPCKLDDIIKLHDAIRVAVSKGLLLEGSIIIQFLFVFCISFKIAKFFSNTWGMIPQVNLLIGFLIRLEIIIPGSHRIRLLILLNKLLVKGPLNDKIFKLWFFVMILEPIDPVPNIVIGLKFSLKSLFHFFLKLCLSHYL